MSILVPGSGAEALAAVPVWWTAVSMYEDLQALPATGAFFIPAAADGLDPLLVKGKVSYVFIFEVDRHAHEFLDAFHEVNKENPKLQAVWKHCKVIGLRPGQVVNVMIKHRLVPVQVRRDWAPALFKRYRDGHVKSQALHGPAIQFAVDQALEDYARIGREKRGV